MKLYARNNIVKTRGNDMFYIAEVGEEYLYTNGFDIYVRQVTGVRIDDHSRIKYIDDSRSEWEEDVMFHHVGDLIKFMEQTLLADEKHTKDLLEKFL